MALATEVTTDRALDSASAVLRSSLRQGTMIEFLGSIMAADRVSTCCYLFGTESSFALIAGDDRMCPVLGWSDNNGLDFANLPDPVAALFDQYRQVYATLPDGPAHPDWDVLRSETATSSKVIETARWGQWTGYNRYTPVFNGAHAAVGCLPLAAGIIMNVHGYPTEPAHKLQHYAGLDVPNVPFDWGAIPQGAPANDAESQAVSTLLWHIGAHFSANYGASATGASMDEAFAALKNVYKMAPTIRQLSRDWLPDSVWFGLLRTEIDEGRPVLYASSQVKGIRHAFVCDGYADNGAFHFNWGWNGNGNGFYQITALTPCDMAALDQDQEMILGIQPPSADVTGIQQAMFSQLSADYSADARFFQVQCQLFNLGSVPWTGWVSLGRYSSDGTLVGTVTQPLDVQQLKVGSISKPLVFPVTLDSPLRDGEALRVVWAQNDPSDWQPMLPHKRGVSCLTNQGLVYGTGYVDPSEPKVILLNNLAKDYYLPITEGELSDDRGFFQFPFAVGGYAYTDRIKISFSDEEWEFVGHFVLDYATDMQGSDWRRLSFDDTHEVEIPLPAPADQVSSLYLRPWSDQPGFHIYKIEAVNGANKNYGSYWSFNFNEPLELMTDRSVLAGEVGEEIRFFLKFKQIDAYWQGGSFTVGGLLRGLKAGQAELLTADDLGNWNEVNLIETSEGLAFLNHSIGELYDGHSLVWFKLISHVPVDELSGQELVIFPYTVNEFYIREAPECVWPLSITGEATHIEGASVSDQSLATVTVSDGRLLVRTPCAAVVSVVDMMGHSRVTEQWIQRTASFYLPHGLYVVRVGNKVHRVLVH